MYEDFATKLAKIMTEYSQPVKPGDWVWIGGNTLSIPVTEALYEAVLRCGGNPSGIAQIPGLNELKLTRGNEDQIKFVDPVARLVSEKADILYNIWADSNTKGLSSVDPQRIAMFQDSQRELQEIFFKRMASGDLRWCILPWPTDSMAQEAGKGLHAYKDFVYKACGFDQDDPIAYWQGFKERQTRLVDWLATKERMAVKGPGIDLSFGIKGRVWVSCHGDNNFPDGEIFTGPIEDSVNGTVEFNVRTMHGGREVDGVKFTYKDGVIVEASAERGEDFLMSQLDLDEGARRMGEFAIGTNFGIQEVTGNTLFDEKIGGTIHMAIGRSIPESKGTNYSVVHWDMVHDMKEGGEIYVDGELFYKDGDFVV